MGKQATAFVPHFTGGNAKLKKDNIVTFNLPAGKSCPKAGVCKRYCYASKGNYCFPAVKQNAENNFAASKSSEFVRWMCEECARILEKGINRVRLHSSGDFYSQSYLDKWVTIMTCFPEIQFYAYTKSLHLDWSKALELPNFTWIQSEGGLMDDAISPDFPVARIFADTVALAEAGFVNGSKSDLVALKGTRKIGLVKH